MCRLGWLSPNRNFFLFPFTWVLISCNPPRPLDENFRKHSPGVSHSDSLEVLQNRSELGEEKTSGWHSLQKALAGDQNSKSLPSFIRHVLVPLQKKLFSKEILKDPRKIADPGFKKTFWEFNRLVLVAAAKSPKELDQSRILEGYQKTLLEGCVPGGLRNCRNLELFSQDHQSVGICKLIARGLPAASVREYYRMLFLAYEILKSSPDSELDALFLDRAKEYLESFSQNDKKIGRDKILSSTDIQTENFRSFVGLMHTLLLKAKNLVLAPSTGEHLTHSKVKQILSLAVDEKFNEILSSQLKGEFLKAFASQLHNPEAWTAFENLVTTLRDSSNSASNSQPDAGHFKIGLLTLAPNYGLAKNELQSIGTNIIAALNITFHPSLDFQSAPTFQDVQLYNFIISSLYRSQKHDILLPFWNITKKDLKGFSEMLENFLTVIFAHNALATHFRISAIVQEFQKNGAKPEDYVFLVIDRVTAEVEPLWREYFSRVRQMRLFFEREIETQGYQSKDPLVNLQVQTLRRFFRQLGHNAKLVVTYPNLIMLCYFMSKVDFKKKIEFNTFNGPMSFEFNAEVVLEDLMAGRMPPLYIFSDGEDDNKGLDKLEMNFALYYMMKMNLPELYQVSLVDWFRSLNDIFLKSVKGDLNDWAVKLRELTTQNSNYSTFLYQCKTILNPEAESFSMNNFFSLEKIKGRTFFYREISGNGYSSKEILAEMLKFIAPGFQMHSVAEALEVVRLDVIPRLNHLKLIKKILMQTPSAQNGVIGEIEKVLKEYEDLSQYVFQTVVTFQETLSNCIFEMSRIEHVRRTEVFNMEVDFNRHIYIAMSALYRFRDKRSHTTSELKNFEHPIWNEPFFADLDNSLPLLKSINELIKKRASYDKAFLQVEDYEANYDLLGGIQYTAEGQVYYAQRAVDLAVRLRNFMMFGYYGKKRSYLKDRLRVELPGNLKGLIREIYFIREQDNINLDYFDSKDGGLTEARIRSFQIDASREMARGSYDWFNDSYPMGRFHRIWLKLVALIYKLKFEIQMDVSNFETESAIEAHIEKMRSASKYLFTESLKVLNQANLNTFADDTATLQWLESTRMFSKHETYAPGPKHLFTENNDELQFRYLGLADEIYNNVSAIELGTTFTSRGFRPKGDADMADAINPGSNTGAAGEMSFGSTSSESTFVVRFRDNPFDSAEKYFAESLRKQKERVLFPIEESVRKEINFNYVGFLATEMLLMHALEIEGDIFKKNTSIPPMWFDTLQEKFNHDYLISPGLYNSYHDDISRFNERTFNLFLPKGLSGKKGWTYLETNLQK